MKLADKLRKLAQESKTEPQEKPQEEPKESPPTKHEVPETTELAQCDCGGALFGECPDCDEVDDSNDVLKSIREIGDKQEINPQEPQEKETEKETEEPQKSSSKAQKMKREPKHSGTCPTCEKHFKHLSRHKCKKNAPPEPQETEEEPKTDPPTEQTEPTEEPTEALQEPQTIPSKIFGKIPKDDPRQDPDGGREVALQGTARPVKQVREALQESSTTISVQTIGPDPEQVAESVKETLEKAKIDIVGMVPPGKDLDEAAEKAKEKFEQLEEVRQEKESKLELGETPVFFELYLDCEIIKSCEGDDIVRFEDLIRVVAEEVARASQAEHWKCIDYGKGEGYLAASLERWILLHKFEGIILADSSTTEVRACKGVLKRYARNIVQGVR